MKKEEIIATLKQYDDYSYRELVSNFVKRRTTPEENAAILDSQMLDRTHATLIYLNQSVQTDLKQKLPSDFGSIGAHATYNQWRMKAAGFSAAIRNALEDVKGRMELVQNAAIEQDERLYLYRAISAARCKCGKPLGDNWSVAGGDVLETICHSCYMRLNKAG